MIITGMIQKVIIFVYRNNNQVTFQNNDGTV